MVLTLNKIALIKAIMNKIHLNNILMNTKTTTSMIQGIKNSIVTKYPIKKLIKILLLYNLLLQIQFIQKNKIPRKNQKIISQ